MSGNSQRSFARGEVSPSLYARTDVQAYATALRTCRNMLVLRQGGAAYRPGTAFVAAVKDSSATVRLFKFVFAIGDAFVMEFGAGYIRWYQDGAPLTVSGVAAYAGGTTYAIGDLVVSVGVTYYCIQAGVGHTPASSATYWYPLTGSIYEIPTGYAQGDLAGLAIVQSADVVTIVHPSYPPAELRRYADTTWTLASVSFDPSIAAPTNVARTAGGSAATATNVAYWGVTAVDPSTGEESLLSVTRAGPYLTPVAGTAASYVTMTWTANPAVPNATYRIYRSLNGVFSYVGVGGAATPVTAATNTFTNPPDFTPGASTVLPAVTHIPIASEASVRVYVDGSHFPSPDGWDVDLASGIVTVYNVDPSATTIRVDYEYVGAAATTFQDVGIIADTTVNPPIAFTGLQTPDNYPAVVGYYQQRLLFANTNTEPTRVWASRTGLFHNFTAHTVLQADDAFNFSLANAEVDAVRHLIELGKLVVGTEGSEMLIEGDANGVLSPLAINSRVGSYNGANRLRPVKVDNSILYVQALGTLVRELISNIQYGYYQFSGADLTVYASHFFDAHSLADWDYQQIFPQIVWVVRDDGVLLGLTYIREQEMVAWHQHTTDGTFENVCVIPEGGEHRLYAVVKRTINGAVIRSVERFQSLHLSDIVEDAAYMDKMVSWDGRGYGTTVWPGATLTLSGGTTWAFDDLLTCTGSHADTFAVGDVGSARWLTQDGVTVKFTVQTRVSDTVATGFCDASVPYAMRGVAVGTWAVARAVLTTAECALAQLEGKAVSVFADGFVVASPNNPQVHTTVTVTAGVADLGAPYTFVRLGLPYMGDMETLDIDTATGPSFKESAMNVSRVGIYVERSNTRGTFVGLQAPTGDDPVYLLDEVKGREVVDYSDPLTIVSDYVEVNVPAKWSKGGRVFLRQVDPVPMTVLAVMPYGFLPTQGG